MVSWFKEHLTKLIHKSKKKNTKNQQKPSKILSEESTSPTLRLPPSSDSREGLSFLSSHTVLCISKHVLPFWESILFFKMITRTFLVHTTIYSFFSVSTIWKEAISRMVGNRSRSQLAAQPCYQLRPVAKVALLRPRLK